jgi:16S rRNA U516 pseudouridylate synthase RsuA-like enzyme
VGLALVSLQRTRVGPVTLGVLPEGEYRALTPSELEALQ